MAPSTRVPLPFNPLDWAFSHVERLREGAREAKKSVTPIAIPQARYSPFLHKLKRSLDDLQKSIGRSEKYAAGDTARNLLSAGKAKYYHRSADDQTQHEDDTCRSAAKPSYFHADHMPKEHLSRLLRADASPVSDHKTAWIRKLMD